MNRIPMTVSIAAIVCAAVVAPSFAAPTTTLVQVPIAAAAIAADPALANYQTWDLRVNIDPGYTWSNTGFNVRLEGGAFYNPPLSAQGPLPQLWDLFPHLRHDTFITQAARPDDPSTFVLPLIHSGYPQPNPVVYTDTEMSLAYSWTPLRLSGPGVLTVARFTVPHGATGAVVGESSQLFPDASGGQTLPFAVFIPEPTSATALAAAALLLMRRWRR